MSACVCSCVLPTLKPRLRLEASTTGGLVRGISRVSFPSSKETDQKMIQLVHFKSIITLLDSYLSLLLILLPRLFYLFFEIPVTFAARFVRGNWGFQIAAAVPFMLCRWRSMFAIDLFTTGQICGSKRRDASLFITKKAAQQVSGERRLMLSNTLSIQLLCDEDGNAHRVLYFSLDLPVVVIDQRLIDPSFNTKYKHSPYTPRRHGHPVYLPVLLLLSCTWLHRGAVSQSLRAWHHSRRPWRRDGPRRLFPASPQSSRPR